jgi:photosystem II stability/assembly factor-like uncharacterized protein
MKHTRVAEENVTIVDLHAFSSVSAVVIAEEGGVYISTDRGESWEQTANLNEPVDIGFFDESAGFISTNAGSIWRSTDGGETWAESLVQSGASWRTAVTIPGSSAVIAGTNGWMAYTSDAGETWNVEQPDPNVSFRYSGYDDGLFYLLDTFSEETSIYTLSADFTEISELPFSPPRDTQLFDIMNGEIILYYLESPLFGCLQPSVQAGRYTDNGNGWEAVGSFSYISDTFGVARIPDSHSYLRFGSDAQLATALGVVTYEDGIVTENYSLNPAQGSGNSLTPDIRQLVKTGEGVTAFAHTLCNNGGTISDHYYTFQISENSRVWNAQLDLNIEYAAIRESGSGLVFKAVAGDGYSVYSTTDSGVTSENLDLQTPEKVAGAVWLDDTFLVAAGEGGAIMFYDGSDLVTAGSAEGPLTGITKLDENTALAVGTSGRAVRISRSGEITSLQTPTDADLTAVYAQGDVILASGTNGTILRSTDEGSSWEKIITSTEADLFAIALHESGTGFATGAAGTLLTTTDAGMVWEEESPLTESTLRTILISDVDNIWIAGDDGAIFYNDTGGFTSITDPNPNSGETPNETALKQNYPNPFNPTTNVVYELSEAVDVRLEVFNVLGQRVSVLHNGMQTAGTHTASFDGSGLSSGIYLVRMQAGGQIFTNKMMLVK